MAPFCPSLESNRLVLCLAGIHLLSVQLVLYLHYVFIVLSLEERTVTCVIILTTPTKAGQAQKQRPSLGA